MTKSTFEVRADGTVAATMDGKQLALTPYGDYWPHEIDETTGQFEPPYTLFRDGRGVVYSIPQTEIGRG